MRTSLWPSGIVLMALACPAFAQDDAAQTVTYDCISDETVEGELIRPTGETLYGRELLARIEVPAGWPEDLERRETWIDRKLHRRSPMDRALVLMDMGDRYWAEADRVFADGMAAVEAQWAAGEDPVGQSLAVDAEYGAILAVALKWYERAALEPVPDALAGQVQLRRVWILFELGRTDEAVEGLTAIAQSDAGHRERAHATLLLGDHYFTFNNVFAAASAYEEVVRSDEPTLSWYAGYKLAWCHYNLGEYALAAETLMTVVDRCAAHEGTDALLNEVRRDAVIMAGELATVGEAMAIVRRSCLDDQACEAKGFENLARWYDQIGKAREASEVRGDPSQ